MDLICIAVDKGRGVLDALRTGRLVLKRIRTYNLIRLMRLWIWNARD
jgi:hypothetical protein